MPVSAPKAVSAPKTDYIYLLQNMESIVGFGYSVGFGYNASFRCCGGFAYDYRFVFKLGVGGSITTRFCMCPLGSHGRRTPGPVSHHFQNI
jgi:hypothetical protein